MKVSELLKNSGFDVNAQVIVYDCNKEECWHTAPVLYDRDKDSLSDAVANMDISYITVIDSIMRIEAKNA